MSAKRWQRLEALFDEGLQVDAARREQWLAGLPDDAELITELRSMLAADDVTDRLKACIGNALAPADEQPLSGARLGAWRLVSELGSGGMGVVFLAEREDGGFRQQAAIKVMQLLGGGNAAQQLRHERQILAETQGQFLEEAIADLRNINLAELQAEHVGRGIDVTQGPVKVNRRARVVGGESL